MSTQQEPASPPTRASLVNRLLPSMTLSTAANPLTAAQPPPEQWSAEEKARYRFQVKGNVVVTGGTGTLALEAARALLEHGASGLALWDLDPTQGLSAVQKLRADFSDRRITTATVDVQDADAIAAAMASTLRELGTVDILCCFAGIVSCTHALGMGADAWRRVLDVNLNGSFLCAQAFAQQLVRQGTGGSVVFTASISARHTNFPQPQCAYNASKAALLSLAKSLAAEWSAYGIRVNCLSPGYADTILNAGPGLQEARDIWNARNPMGRMAHPWELTGPLITLCSNAGRYINGTDIVVDGGTTVF